MMNAIDFIYERVRMCETIGTCFDCPFREFDGCDLDDLVESGNVEKAVKIVKKWSKENPRKTRQSLFLEQHPGASIGPDGVLTVCPFLIDASYRSNEGGCAFTHRHCSDCRKKFWNQEIKNM